MVKIIKMPTLNLYKYDGFVLTKGDTSPEAVSLSIFCLLNSIPLIYIPQNQIIPHNYIPCGGVEWCEQTLGKHITPDYYPEWASEYLYRKVWLEDKWILEKKLFVKPADRYKRFNGFITTGTYKQKKKGKLIWSEIIHFDNEWRYYISHGIVLTSGWYSGDDVNTPNAPELNINIPKEYCGALDFGMTNHGLTLIESQHPFACGWYGPKEQDYLYFQWLIEGWIYMKKI